MYWHVLIIPNISYFGYVLADSIYGPETLLNVMIFSLPILIFNYSIGYCTLTKTPLNIKTLLKPTIITILLGSIFGLLDIPIPDIFSDLTDKASACVGPISMILTGMVISEYKIPSLLQNHKAYIVALFRLLIIPAVIAGILGIFFMKEIVLASLLVYAMPCPMNTIVFSRSVGENCETGAEMVFISTIASIITIPIMI